MADSARPGSEANFDAPKGVVETSIDYLRSAAHLTTHEANEAYTAMTAVDQAILKAFVGHGDITLEDCVPINSPFRNIMNRAGELVKETAQKFLSGSEDADGKPGSSTDGKPGSPTDAQPRSLKDFIRITKETDGKPTSPTDAQPQGLMDFVPITKEPSDAKQASANKLDSYGREEPAAIMGMDQFRPQAVKSRIDEFVRPTGGYAGPGSGSEYARPGGGKKDGDGDGDADPGRPGDVTPDDMQRSIARWINPSRERQSGQQTEEKSADKDKGEQIDPNDMSNQPVIVDGVVIRPGSGKVWQWQR